MKKNVLTVFSGNQWILYLANIKENMSFVIYPLRERLECAEFAVSLGAFKNWSLFTVHSGRFREVYHASGLCSLCLLFLSHAPSYLYSFP